MGFSPGRGAREKFVVRPAGPSPAAPRRSLSPSPSRHEHLLVSSPVYEDGENAVPLASRPDAPVRAGAAPNRAAPANDRGIQSPSGHRVPHRARPGDRIAGRGPGIRAHQLDLAQRNRKTARGTAPG